MEADRLDLGVGLGLDPPLEIFEEEPGAAVEAKALQGLGLVDLGADDAGLVA
jgi:hypothetical protein